MPSRTPTVTPTPFVPAPTPSLRSAGTAYFVMHQSARNGYEEAFADAEAAEAFRLSRVASHPRYANDDFFVEEVELKTLDGARVERAEDV